MPRHYSCASPHATSTSTADANRSAAAVHTCTLPQIRQLLDEFEQQGYSVLNIDWPVDSGPDALYEGFGARDYYAVDPLLASPGADNATVLAEWHALVRDAHARGMRVISDFNPSYFWSGAPIFKAALADVNIHGPVRANQPPDSPARWFRYSDVFQ